MKISTIKNAVLISILMILGTTNLYSQNSNTSKGYLSYFGNDSTNINIVSTPCYGGDEWYNMTCTLYSEDTIRVNGNLYYYKEPHGTVHPSHPKLDYCFPLYDTLFVREDTATGRLYRYYRDFLGSGESEKLVCDMTLEMGDVFMIYTCHPEGEEPFTVVDINYNNDVKTIRLSNGWDIVYFTEGVLPRISPLYLEPGLWTNMVFESELLCEHKDGVQVYVNGQLGCYGSHPWNIDETEEEPFTINPNPTNSIVTISGENISKIEVLNALGQKVSETECNENEITIDISHQPAGIYFLNITDKKGEKITKKVVKE